MPTETKQLNVRIPLDLLERLEAHVASEKQSSDVKHGYSKNDAACAALRAWLDADREVPAEADLLALCDRLERVADDLDRLRDRVAKEATHA